MWLVSSTQWLAIVRNANKVNRFELLYVLPRNYFWKYQDTYLETKFLGRKLTIWMASTLEMSKFHQCELRATFAQIFKSSRYRAISKPVRARSKTTGRHLKIIKEFRTPILFVNRNRMSLQLTHLNFDMKIIAFTRGKLCMILDL